MPWKAERACRLTSSGRLTISRRGCHAATAGWSLIRDRHRQVTSNLICVTNLAREIRLLKSKSSKPSKSSKRTGIAKISYRLSSKREAVGMFATKAWRDSCRSILVKLRQNYWKVARTYTEATCSKGLLSMVTLWTQHCMKYQYSKAHRSVWRIPVITMLNIRTRR